eukprot:1388937-Amorphochlora_amoeboformis.AAC.2
MYEGKSGICENPGKNFQRQGSDGCLGDMFGRKKVDLGGSKQDRKGINRTKTPNSECKEEEGRTGGTRQAGSSDHSISEVLSRIKRAYPFSNPHKIDWIRKRNQRRLVYKRAVDEFKHISTEIAAQAKTKKKGKRGSTISRLLYITSLLIRLQKSQPSLDKKSKALHARRVQAALVYVVARAKKTDKGNYFLGLVDRNMRRRKECANQLSFFARVGAQMVAEMK